MNVIASRLIIFPHEYTQKNTHEAHRTQPVGTGPYMFVEYVQGDHLTLKRNPNYWGPKTSVGRITLKDMDDPATQKLTLEKWEEYEASELARLAGGRRGERGVRGVR